MSWCVARTAALCALVSLAAACGKKGPPLAPIVRIPAAIESPVTRRVGNDVFVTVTIPSENIDRTMPVDVARVEVYGFTGLTPPPPGRFTEAGTLVASIPVAPPAGAPAAQPPLGDPATMAAVGGMATVLDRLTPEDFQPGPVLQVELPRGARPLPPPVQTAAPAGPLRRYYVAIGVSAQGEAGSPGAVVELPLFPLPDPPSPPQLAATATTTTVAWEPAAGTLAFLTESPLGPEPSPLDDPLAPARAASTPAVPAAPTGPVRFNVYLTRSGPPPAGAAEPVAATSWAAAPRTPLNAAPLTELQFIDPTVTFGVERCYAVSAVQGTAPNVLEGEPSPERCITAIDTFPPAPPAGLTGVAAEGLISLIWEVSSDPDFAGYLILRGAPGDATLQPLTPMPIAEARFTDMTVRPGVTYVYAVVAVDMANNQSTESNRVEETAR